MPSPQDSWGQAPLLLNGLWGHRLSSSFLLGKLRGPNWGQWERKWVGTWQVLEGKGSSVSNMVWPVVPECAHTGGVICHWGGPALPHTKKTAENSHVFIASAQEVKALCYSLWGKTSRAPVTWHFCGTPGEGPVLSQQSRTVLWFFIFF